MTGGGDGGAVTGTIPAENPGSVKLRDQHPHLEDQAHLVYRLLDRDGMPLYIGCTSNLEQRLAALRTMRPLWARTASVTTEAYPTRSAALAAERSAIRAECPSWNTHWNQYVTEVCEAMFVEAHGRPASGVVEAWDHGRAHHDELVRRVRQCRGEIAGSFALGGAR